MTNTLHAHVETHATDCDGPLSSGYLLTMNDHEQADQFGDIKFMERVVSHVVNVYSLFRSGTLQVDCLDESSTEKRLSWSEQTEEGHRSVEATICTDDCDLSEDSWRRDHQAEAAGY